MEHPLRACRGCLRRRNTYSRRNTAKSSACRSLLRSRKRLRSSFRTKNRFQFSMTTASSTHIGGAIQVRRDAQRTLVCRTRVKGRSGCTLGRCAGVVGASASVGALCRTPSIQRTNDLFRALRAPAGDSAAAVWVTQAKVGARSGVFVAAEGETEPVCDSR